MKRRLTHLAFNAMLLMALLALAFPTLVSAEEATRISGMAYPAAPGQCTHTVGEGANLAMRLSGDLQGCYYIFVESFVCLPNGIYRMSGNEVFVKDGSDGNDLFRTTYNFEGKYVDCATQLIEIFGRCQHPITAGTGTGIYEGVTGRIDVKDDVKALEFNYRGYLQY